MTGELPVGPALPPVRALIPERRLYAGTFVSLRPIEPETDSADLFRISHGSPQQDRIWTYMGYGPFASPEAMRGWLAQQAEKTDPLFFTVVDNSSRLPLGMTSFLNIVPEMRRLEIGHIWYGLHAQRTRANTEAAYLMLQAAFEDWRYRRVEWKCDSLNARSRAAAKRLGFRYEGLFRQHMIVKGRSRDTTWFAMLDEDWPGIKVALKRWLHESAPGTSLHALIRETLASHRADRLPE